MFSVSELSLAFSDKKLFEEVNLQFTPGNCYGIIGANGAGKSTFLKILSGEIEPDRGNVSKKANTHIGILRQDQNMFDKYDVLSTIFMGYEYLYNIKIEKDSIYEKEDFTDADGIRAGELEEQFTTLGGWEAESEMGILLDGLGLPSDVLYKNMQDLEPTDKIRVLLAQALFGNPDILLLDEPTNGLDLESIQWLEDFLMKFENISIIVSHNRHFLNAVCTYTLDIDYGKISMFVGNYDFWFESSQLMKKQRKTDEKKTELRKEELQAFIRRFSANASKSKQATSRKKLLDKIELDEMPRTSRKIPYVHFKPARECGKNIVETKNITLEHEGKIVLEDYSFMINPGDKIAFVGGMNITKTVLFETLAGKRTQKKGSFEWGSTISYEYYPVDNTEYFDTDMNVFEWLSTYTDSNDDLFIRGFLGRMLFSGDEIFKKVGVLSGGEKARCLLAKVMLTAPNVIIFDEPTNHLDLEAITSLNQGLVSFDGVLLFNSHDQQFIDTVANRIIEFTPKGVIDQTTTFSEYLENPRVREMRDAYYEHHERVVL